jgi:hypothetical protein
MNDYYLYALGSALVVRSLTLVISGVCIYLGYRLLSKGESSRSDISGGTGRYRLEIKNITSGSLFALFGATVMIWSLGRPLLPWNYEEVMTTSVPRIVNQDNATSSDTLGDLSDDYLSENPEERQGFLQKNKMTRQEYENKRLKVLKDDSNYDWAAHSPEENRIREERLRQIIRDSSGHAVKRKWVICGFRR